MIKTVKTGLPKDRARRDEILQTAFHWCERNVSYVPLAIEEDINSSYADDSLEDFERTVKGWLEALRDAEARRRSA